MITATQFNSKLTELNIEFRKVIDAGNTAEAFRWLLETVEFLEALSREMLDMYGVTEEEKVDIRHYCFSLQSIRENITSFYQPF